MKQCQAETLTGTSFKDGSLLESFGERHVNAFRQLLPEEHKPLTGKRTWGSLCSGSEGAHFTHNIVGEQRSKEGMMVCYNTRIPR